MTEEQVTRLMCMFGGIGIGAIITGIVAALTIRQC